MFLIFLIGLLVPSAYAMFGIDASASGFTADAMKCLKDQKNVEFVIFRCYCSNGKLDSGCIDNIRNAWSVNITYVAAYMFPCWRCRSKKSGYDQAIEAADYIIKSGVQIKRFWIDVEGPGEWWGTDQVENVKFFEDIIRGMKNFFQIGIYTSKRVWPKIMGDEYTGGSSFPVWYAHYDHIPNFDDWKNNTKIGDFGGWKEPSIKQYRGTTAECGIASQIDLDWCDETIKSCPWLRG